MVMSTDHIKQLQAHCRVCAGRLSRVSFSSSEPKTCSPLLSDCLGIDAKTDLPHIHPPKTCNKCYATMKKIQKGAVSSLQPFPFTEHFDDDDCGVCTHFSMMSKGGRPSKKRHTLTGIAQHIRMCAGPKLSHKKFSLSFSRFYAPPQSSISLTDIQCPICKCIVDQPIEIPCKVPACLDCCLWLIQKGDMSNCPSCGSEHEVDFSTFSQIPAFLLKILLQQVLHCICSKPVRLEHLRAHLDTSCKELVADIPSSVTLEQILEQPLDTPPTTFERQVVGHLFRKMMQQSTHSQTVTVPTGGHVSVGEHTHNTHTHTQHTHTQKRVNHMYMYDYNFT